MTYRSLVILGVCVSFQACGGREDPGMQTPGGAGAIVGSTGGARPVETGGGATAQNGGAPNQTGGAASLVGGATSPTGGSASHTGGGTGSNQGGSTSNGTGGATAGSGTGGSPSDANDGVGQNPFVRAPSDGVLVTSSDGLNSTALVIAADAHDNLLIAGATRNPAAMGLPAFDSGVVSEAFAAKLDAQGKLVWSVPLKPCGVPARIAAGPDDAAYVLCPNEPDVATLMPSTCDAQALVTKLASNDGHVLFQTAAAPASEPADSYWCPYALAVDAQGQSYVGGGYTSSFPVTQAVILGLSSSGTQMWTWTSGGPSDTSLGATAYAQALAIDSNGNLLATGSFNNWMSLGTTTLTSQAFIGQWSSYNGFIGRLSGTGTGATGWLFGGPVFDLGMAIKSAGSGGYYLGGVLSGTSTLGGKGVSASADGAAFVARLDSSGAASWVGTVGTKSVTRDLANDASGKVYIVGSFSGSELFYTYDPTVSTLTAHSTVLGNSTNNGLVTQSIAITTSGAIYVTGNFSGTIDLGRGKLTTSTVSAFLWRAN